jgi:predicted permease
MDAEMRMHLELEAEELVRQGVPVDEARRRAAVAFGGVQQAKEEALDDHRLWWLDTLRRDVRIATRILLRQPTFAVTVVLALSLAIAVNTTMFSVIDAMINPASSVRKPEQVYGISYYGTSRQRYDQIAHARVFASGGRTFSAYSGEFPRGFAKVERDGVSRTSGVLRVRSNFFTLMGLAPLNGSLAPPVDGATARLAVISERMRDELFRDGESPVGKSIGVNGDTYVVRGVLARDAGLPLPDVEVWVFATSGEFAPINLIRLRDGVTVRDAEREFAVLAKRLGVATNEQGNNAHFLLVPFGRQFYVQQFHYALIGAAIAVLLVACTNLANLQLARGIGRAGELAVRSALGASRAQLIVQLLVESAVLAAAATVLAVLLAVAGNALVRANIPPHIGRFIVEPQTSWRMVVFAAAAAVLSLVIIGLIPAVRVSRIDLNSLIKSRAGTGAHRTNRRTYGALVTAQIALAFPLVCAAVLLTSTALRLADMDFLIGNRTGYDPRPIVIAQITFPPSPDSTRSMTALTSELIARARGIADVSEAAVIMPAPVLHDAITVTDVDGAVREVPAPMFHYQIVTPGYLRAMGMPVEPGRDFQEGGHVASSVILDRVSGRFLWPRSNAVGRSIKLGDRTSNEPWLKVDGISGDHFNEETRAFLRGWDSLHVTSVLRTITIADSLPASKQPFPITMIVRTTRDPQRVASTLQQLLRGVLTTPPRVELAMENAGIPDQIKQLRFIAGLFVTLGTIALGLSALGVYGVVAQAAADRRREVAVRMSLGASPRKIVYALIRDGNVLVLAGVAIGLLVTKQTIVWLQAFLGDVGLNHAFVFGVLCVLVFAVVVIAALVPALRATRVEPMQVLRGE